jgi:hypothetical protein
MVNQGDALQCSIHAQPLVSYERLVHKDSTAASRARTDARNAFRRRSRVRDLSIGVVRAEHILEPIRSQASALEML